MEKVKETKKKKTEKVEYFTDDIAKEIYPFQPALSSRGIGSNKPITNTISIKRTRK